VSGSESEAVSISQLLRDLVRHPVQHLVRRWNWKSAVLSSAIRSALFFAANLNAGLGAARAAFLTELVFRCATAGFYGALTQAFRRAQPAWTGMVAAMLLLPITTHLLELAVHWLRGTVNLAASLTVSVAFTSLSTCFNLFAMRRGALIVGAASDSIWTDLGRTPRILLAFIGEGCGALGRFLRYVARTTGTRPRRNRPRAGCPSRGRA
jgi:hypothetical protein